ncbi:hypothetical protein GJ496_011452 [Pomphorhynchus laevis]|nr:hypothetical protein GJ496_011452 [Pomphorhynchus laevis]
MTTTYSKIFFVIVLFLHGQLTFTPQDFKDITGPSRHLQGEHVYLRDFLRLTIFDLLNTYRLDHDVQMLLLDKKMTNMAGHELYKIYSDRSYEMKFKDILPLLFSLEISTLDLNTLIPAILKEMFCKDRLKGNYPNYKSGKPKPFEYLVWASMNSTGIDFATVGKDGNFTVLWVVLLNVHPHFDESISKRQNLKRCSAINECGIWPK